MCKLEPGKGRPFHKSRLDYSVLDSGSLRKFRLALVLRHEAVSVDVTDVTTT